VLSKLLEQWSVMVHLDPRPADVRVPSWFKKQPQLALQIGLNLPVPIRDLQIDDEGVSCTLSFNRSPHFCFIPWHAVFALVGEDSRGMVWPDSVPAEITVAQQTSATPTGAAKPTPVRSQPRESQPKKVSRGAGASRSSKPAGLRAVTGGSAESSASVVAAVAAAPAASEPVVAADSPAEPAVQGTPGQATQKAPRPSYLRVVK
jgi:stringent starvation protein B